MPGARFGGPKPPDAGPCHYAVFRGGDRTLCGLARAPKVSQKDANISCEDCLTRRLAQQGVAYAERALFRSGATPDERVALLRRALKSAKRLTRWKVARKASG